MTKLYSVVNQGRDKELDMICAKEESWRYDCHTRDSTINITKYDKIEMYLLKRKSSEIGLGKQIMDLQVS